jgi:hyaluronan synthase
VAKARFARVRWSTGLVLGFVGIAALFVIGESALGQIGLAFLAVKLLLSAGSQRRTPPNLSPSTAGLRVVVLVPVYNEDPEIIRRSVRSMLAQTRLPDRIHVIDDGSRTTDAIDAVREERIGAEHRIRITRHHRNMGKREALATGARAESDADIFVTVDSDTVLDERAVEEIVAVFRDRTVFGATGLVRVLNRRRNVLTRLIDLRYANAFLLDRGFQSSFGSVLCACGSLAAWRKRVLLDNLDDFVNQRFLGRRCTYGDDRRLTNYALGSGRVLLARNAVAYTAAPERMSHFLRQQARWCRSFVRESLWAVMHLPLSRPAMWLSLAEFTGWILFTFLMVVLIFAVTVMGAAVAVTTISAYIVFTSLIAWVRSVRWFDARVDNEPHSERVITFLLAPVYAVMSLFLLLPVRVVALLTIRTTSWGTRDDVEVRLEAPEHPPRVTTVGRVA